MADSVIGFSPNWLYGQLDAGLAFYVAAGTINGKLFNGRVVYVPANATTSISMDSSGNLIAGLVTGKYPIATVVTGAVFTGGTPTTANNTSPGVQSITDLRPAGIFSFS